MADQIWMFHAETGNHALLPDTLFWRGKGWEPASEAPPEPDRLHDPAEPAEVDTQVRPDSTPIDAPRSDTEPVGGSQDPQTQPTPAGTEPVPAPTTSSKAAKQAATTTEEA